MLMSSLSNLNKNLKFIFYKRKGRKFLLRKKFINPFVTMFHIFIKNKIIKKKNLMYGIFIKNANFGLYSIYHFMYSYNIWYNKLIIQNTINFNVSNAKYLLTNFRDIKNKNFSNKILEEILQSVFLKTNKNKNFSQKFNKKLTFSDRVFQEKLKIKKRNSFHKLGFKLKKINKVAKNKIYFDFNFNYINFHKIFLNIISKIGNHLSSYYDSFYNNSDLNKFPIKQDHISLKKKILKDRFLNQLNIVFAFVKEKFLIVNLIDPSIGLNLYSSHPAMARRGISRFFSLSQKEQMNKYVFLFKLKKKKALKNKFLRTLTILGASRRLYSIQRTNLRVLNFILNIPRHIIDKTLYYSFAFFIKPYSSLDIPIEDIRQRLDYDPARDKRLKIQYGKGYTHNLIRNFKEKKYFSSLILKFLIKYLLFLNCKNFGNLFIYKKRNLYFFLFIFAFVLKKIRHVVVLMLRNISPILKYLKIYKKQLIIIKYLLKFFIISYKLQLPYKKDILMLLQSQNQKLPILKTLPIYKLFKKSKILEKYFMRNIFKPSRHLSFVSRTSSETRIHNIVFTSRQSHGALLKISKNRRI